MGGGRRFQIFHEKKTCVYACLRFDALSFGMREVEGYLNSEGIHFMRLVDPDPDFITPEIASVYHGGRFITILEVRDELGRAFYLFSTGMPFDVEALMKPDFALAFSVGNENGFEELMRMIFRRRIAGARYKHRSLFNFFLSFFLSMIISAFIGFTSIVIQAIVVGLVAFILFMIADYPFSVLYFRGVKVIPVPKQRTKVFMIRMKKG